MIEHEGMGPEDFSHVDPEAANLREQVGVERRGGESRRIAAAPDHEPHRGERGEIERQAGVERNP